MTRNVFGAQDSPFVACVMLAHIINNATAFDEEKQVYLIFSFYIDDLVFSSDKEEIREITMKIKLD